MTMEYVSLIGIVVQTIIFLLGGYALTIRNDASNKVLERQVVGIQMELKGLAVVVTTLAVQDERLNNQGQRLNEMDKKIEALRRGDGFIAGRAGLRRNTKSSPKDQYLAQRL